MKGKMILVTVLSVTLFAVSAGLVQAYGGRSGGSDSNAGYSSGYGCQNPGSGRGSGMMGYGSGMMGSGGMRGHMGGDGDGERGDRHWYGFDRKDQRNANITQDEAKAMIELRVSRNPYIQVGKVAANEDGFEIQVVTKKGGDLVNRLQVEKSSGRIFPIVE
ncbi:MAG: hypothetical protein GXP52_05050 [Deltaproteobacteria bacterium]|nr:hypothetical protein [Deltaproteobacteria bacterium]